MLLTRLVLEDFGVFRGRHVFDLAPRPEESPTGGRRPIVLIGGLNGAGKTTIFEAVRLCLYGPLALGSRVRSADYQSYLADRLHRPSPDDPARPKGAALELEFEYTYAGEKKRYRVRRTWHLTPANRVQEDLYLWENGLPLTVGLTPSQWQDFIRELVPPGISQLFFFDGERIQALAEEEDSQELVRSIRALLGLDLVERLQADLTIYLRKQHAQESGHAESIAKLEAEITQLAEELEAQEQERAQLRAKLQHVEGRIERQEQRIVQEGGEYAAQREALKRRLVQLDEKILHVEDRIRELCAGLLPFALAPELCRSLKEQLRREQEKQQWEAFRAQWEQVLPELAQAFFGAQVWEGMPSLPPKERQRLWERLQEELRRRISAPREVEEAPIVHGLSPSEADRLQGWVDQALHEMPQKLREYADQLEEWTRERQEVEQRLERAPSEEALRPLLDELQELHKRRSDLDLQLRRQEERIRSVQQRLEDLQRQRRRLEERWKSARETKRAMQLAL